MSAAATAAVADDRPLGGRAFDLAVRRLADSLAPGLDPAAMVGQGIDYLQSRPFVDGDPVRQIDWRVTARSGRWYLKEHQALQRMPMQLVLDTSSSMRLTWGRRSKAELAAQLGGGLALAALARASPVGLLAAGATPMRCPTTGDRGAILAFLHRMRRPTAPLGEATVLARRLDELRQVLPCRTLVLVLSDLHDPDAVPALKRLALDHEVVVLRLRDQAEDGLPGVGILRAAEAETGAVATTTGRGAWSRGDQALRDLARAGIDTLALVSGVPVVAPLRRFLAGRGRRRSR